MASPLELASKDAGDGHLENPEEFFEKKIRPVLVEHCYGCHSAEANKIKGGLRVDYRDGLLLGGDGGAVLVPGLVKGSRLLDAMRYKNRDLAMPPEGKLPDAIIADFVRWIEAGATDPRDTPPAGKVESEAPFDFTRTEKFWSFQPLARPPVPGTEDPDWARSAIDRFILSGLEGNGLAPPPPADKRTLIRRATFDLTGLPPTPAETQRFLADESPTAYARLVDRLLASPRYGERWGRHWLDVARYADSNGLDENLAYANAFRYRDYVVDAFNEDKPYDQFVREQIAGDLMADPDDEEVTLQRQVATGFLSVGAKMLADDDPVKKKLDIVDEQLDTIGRAFLGLSVGCARCHDHKFDPIPAEDYYSLAGIFTSTKTMETLGVVARWYERSLMDPEVEAQRQIVQKEVEAKKAELARFSAAATKELRAEARQHVASYLVAASEFLEPRERISIEAESFVRGDLTRLFERYGEGIGVIANRSAGYAEYPLRVPRRGKYHVEIRYAAGTSRPVDLLINGKTVKEGAVGKVTGGWNPENQKWFDEGVFELEAGRNVLRLQRGEVFPHIDRLRIRPAGSPPGDGSEETATSLHAIAKAREIRTSLLISWVDYLDRISQETDSVFARWFALEDEILSAAADGKPTEEHRSPLRSLAREYAELFRDGADSGEAYQKIIADPEGPFAARKDIDKDLPPAVTAERERLVKNIKATEKTLPARPGAMGVTDDKIANLRVHLRGNYLTLGEEVPRRLPRMFFAGFESPALPDAESGRRELGKWLTTPDQPLTARVMANRLWRWHFGTGIVRTPDNFGTTGERPSNQALLDWLAHRFVESGWSIKAMHREILLSATYRMGSIFNARAWEIDPENRWHWRFPRRRLEAEALRDALFAISGDLDLTIGGSLLKVANRSYVTSVGSSLTDEYDTRRRSLYLPVVRSALFEMFQAFDFADPSATNGDRATTTVAPQALFLMNSDIVAQQTRRLAERLLALDCGDAERVGTAYQLIYGRPSAAKEARRAIDFMAGYEETLREAAAPAGRAEESRVRSWQAFCRALLGSNEFVYVE